MDLTSGIDSYTQSATVVVVETETITAEVVGTETKLDNRTVAIKRLLTEALTTHSALRDHPAKIEAAVNALMCVNENYLALFIVFTHRATSIGMYAIVHNEIVDKLVLSGDCNALVERAKLGYDALPEVDRNPYLTADETAVIVKSINFDYEAITTVINNYNDSYSDDEFLVACPTDLTITKHSYQNGEKDLHATLYRQCREVVCVANNQPPVASTCMSNTIRVTDSTPGQTMPDIYCFKLEELLAHLARENGPTVTNYLSGSPFHPRTLEHLRARYAKEIAIYRYKLSLSG